MRPENPIHPADYLSLPGLLGLLGKPKARRVRGVVHRIEDDDTRSHEQRRIDARIKPEPKQKASAVQPQPAKNSDGSGAEKRGNAGLSKMHAINAFRTKALYRAAMFGRGPLKTRDVQNSLSLRNAPNDALTRLVASGHVVNRARNQWEWVGS